MIEAYSEQLITIDEMRSRMPQLRAREAGLRAQLEAAQAQAADRDAYLKLAGDLQGFLAQLRSETATASTGERRRVLKLIVKDVLIGPEKITIRHRIPARASATAVTQCDPQPDTEGDHGAGCQVRWGRAGMALHESTGTFGADANGRGARLSGNSIAAIPHPNAAGSCSRVRRPSPGQGCPPGVPMRAADSGCVMMAGAGASRYRRSREHRHGPSAGRSRQHGHEI